MVPALRDTTELLRTLQKWPVLVSLMLLFLRVELVVWCLVWCGGGRIRSGCYGSGRTSNVLSYLNKNKTKH